MTIYQPNKETHYSLLVGGWTTQMISHGSVYKEKIFETTS